VVRDHLLKNTAPSPLLGQEDERKTLMKKTGKQPSKGKEEKEGMPQVACR
jgi:hypothetical protein